MQLIVDMGEWWASWCLLEAIIFTNLVGDSFLQQRLIQLDSAAGILQSPLAFLITHPITITFDVC